MARQGHSSTTETTVIEQAAVCYLKTAETANLHKKFIYERDNFYKRAEKGNSGLNTVGQLNEYSGKIVC